HIGVAAVVEDLGRGACDLGGLVVGAVGEIEAALAVGSGRQGPTRLQGAGMAVQRAAGGALGPAGIAGPWGVVDRAWGVCGQVLARGRVRGVPQARPYAAGRGRIVLDPGACVRLRLEQIAEPRRALAAVEP